MQGKSIVVALAAGIVGLLLGMLFSSSGPDVSEIEEAVGARFEAASEATTSASEAVNQRVDEGLTALSDRLGGLTDRIGALEEQAGSAVEAVTPEDLDALGTRIDDMAQGLRDRIDEVTETQSSMLSQELARLTRPAAAPQDGDGAGQGGEDEAAAAPEDGDAGAGAAAAVSGDAAQDQGEAADDGSAGAGTTAEPEGMAAGHTVQMAEGALRVFVSRVDDAAQTARLSVNGEQINLPVGRAVSVQGEHGECRMRLDGVDRGHARVSALCGDDIPAPAGIRPGSIALLDDGTVRVFLSGVAEDQSSARFAVNGTTLQSAAVGEAVPVDGSDGCRVSVDEIDRGHVSFGYSCGS